ncbi:MAG: nucleoside hydrolase [Gammaproteobacteria bacterium]|nr:nucleoside hydrolase [Gammaproteobacteria bacterium]MYF37253.1 nucleoside hydrolase [Gammaproteobacteria bacterium]
MPSLIIDCDPGCDDAIAILLALKHSDLKAITTVSGNVPLAQTTENALMTIALAKAQTPVYAGASRPLESTPTQTNISHGSDGLGGIERLSHDRTCESYSARDYLLNHVSNEDWVIALGPLTNLGEVLQQDPDWGKRIGGISIMGGSTTTGNISPVAEFNSYTDPHAAAKVYASGAKLIMCGLNLTHQLLVTDSTMTAVLELGTQQSTFVAALLNFLLQRIERSVGTRSAPLHDPCAVLAVTHPSLFDFEELSVEVETEGDLTRGMTVVDQRTTRPRLMPNTLVAKQINVALALQVITDSFVEA